MINLNIVRIRQNDMKQGGVIVGSNFYTDNKLMASTVVKCLWNVCLDLKSPIVQLQHWWLQIYCNLMSHVNKNKSVELYHWPKFIILY